MLSRWCTLEIDMSDVCDFVVAKNGDPVHLIMQMSRVNFP